MIRKDAVKAIQQKIKERQKDAMVRDCLRRFADEMEFAYDSRRRDDSYVPSRPTSVKTFD